MTNRRRDATHFGVNGKGKGKLMDDIQEISYREPLDSNKFPGALRKNKTVQAVMRDNKSWCIAKILEVRVKRADEDEDLNQGAEQKDRGHHRDPSEVNGVHREYEYYITYLEHERRNDRWVPEVCLRIREDDWINSEMEKIDVDKKKNENDAAYANFLKNDVHFGMQPNQIQEFYESTKIKSVEFICFGDAIIEAWYYSPFPKEYQCKILFVCPFCLFFFTKKTELECHSLRCKVRCPPGDEIYRDDKVSVFEFDAKQQKVYTENLGYIARLFLDHKNLAVELDAFYFYILCERRADGYYIVGYFSKQKDSSEHNLSCIMVFPNVQRGGYGKFLIDFSYCLSLIEEKSGSPEKPLSDLGHKTYVSYWTYKILNLLLINQKKELSITDISQQTGITTTDITYVLESY